MPSVPPFLTRKSVVIPVAVVVAAFAAFEGYGAYTRSTPVDYSRGGQAFAAPTPTPGQALPGPPTATGTSSTPAGPSPSTSPSPDQSAASLVDSPTPHPTFTATATQTTAAAGSAPVQASSVAVPRTGTYQLTVDGSEKVKFGAVGFCNQSLPSRTTLVVAKAAGESPTSYDFDLRYFPGQAGQHDERHIYRYTKAATFLDYEIATVTCQGVRQTSETSYSPPQLRAALPLTVGDSWSSKGGDSARTETSSSKVLRTESVLVAGVAVPTYVIATTTSFSGSESGSRSQTWWYSPSWAMPVKWTEQIDGHRSGADYSENVTVAVTARP